MIYYPLGTPSPTTPYRRHAYLRVGYTIRVVQGLGLLGGSTLCAFDARFPVGRVFRDLEPADRDLAAELVLQVRVRVRVS